MTTRLVLNHWSDWLKPGSPDDSRLLHSDASDRIHICPPHLGQGYIQEILLRDDLTLIILDYTLTQEMVIHKPGESSRLEFEFQLAGPDAGYSLFLPYFGFKEFGFKRAQKRSFKVEVCFKQPTLITYLQAFMERLSPQTQGIAERLTQFIYRSLGGGSSSTLAGMLNQILQDMRVKGRSDPIASTAHLFWEHIATDALYAEALVFQYTNRHPIMPAMESVIGQILGCPYRGAIRRTYLERKALKLIELRLEAMVQPRLNQADLDCIYQAASILRTQIVNPPTVEALARQVGTNRFKLNHGFYQVYGATPYSYSRDHRLWQARRLLMTSDLPIGEVAAAVGYASRSNFALAFRQQMGLNPKAFQMEALAIGQFN